MYLHDIKETFIDYPDDESIAVLAFFTGCIHNCEGCYNQELQVVNKDEYLNIEDTINVIINRCKRSDTNKIVLSGGDPFYTPNEVIEVVDHLEKKGYEVCVYTGYTIEKVRDFIKEYEIKHNTIVSKPSWLKCGRFDNTQRDYDSGKYGDKFILATKNQGFYKWSDKLNDYYKASEGNILRFG